MVVNLREIWVRTITKCENNDTKRAYSNYLRGKSVANQGIDSHGRLFDELVFSGLRSEFFVQFWSMTEEEKVVKFSVNILEQCFSGLRESVGFPKSKDYTQIRRGGLRLFGFPLKPGLDSC